MLEAQGNFSAIEEFLRPEKQMLWVPNSSLLILKDDDLAG